MHHLLRANDYFCVFHLRWQSIIFFSIASCYFSKLSLSEECNGLWLKFHSEKLSEIHVVYLMGKIIARQVKQSMTHSNQEDWLKTQVSKEVRLFTLSLLQTPAILVHIPIMSLSLHSFIARTLTYSLTDVGCDKLTVRNVNETVENRETFLYR